MPNESGGSCIIHSQKKTLPIWGSHIPIENCQDHRNARCDGQQCLPTTKGSQIWPKEQFILPIAFVDLTTRKQPRFIWPTGHHNKTCFAAPVKIVNPPVCKHIPFEAGKCCSKNACHNLSPILRSWRIRFSRSFPFNSASRNRHSSSGCPWLEDQEKTDAVVTVVTNVYPQGRLQGRLDGTSGCEP